MKPKQNGSLWVDESKMVSITPVDGLGAAKHPWQSRALISSRDSSPLPKTWIILSLINFNEGDEIKNDQAYINRYE